MLNDQDIQEPTMDKIMQTARKAGNPWMTRNLFETWSILAPTECKFHPESLEGFAYLLKTYKGEDAPVLEIYNILSSRKENLLLGYVQRCIQAREWHLSLEISGTHNTIATIIIPEYQHKSPSFQDKDTTKALLTAYLSALAAQRAIEPGAWLHFKGDRIEVVGQGVGFDPRTFNAAMGESPLLGEFQIEENPSEKVLVFKYGDDLIYATDLEIGFCDRVFYRHGSSQWARKTDNFLGLVGAEHPEHEGKLRFRKVGEAS